MIQIMIKQNQVKGKMINKNRSRKQIQEFLKKHSKLRWRSNMRATCLGSKNISIII